MVLRSHEKYGLRVLAALADAPEGRLPRGELRKRVGMPKRSDSMLSRLLGDFEDHYLVEREPHGRTVDVVLLPDGRALVDDPARRDALERLAELLEQCIEGRWDDAALADVLAVLGVGLADHGGLRQRLPVTVEAVEPVLDLPRPWRPLGLHHHSQGLAAVGEHLGPVGARRQRHGPLVCELQVARPGCWLRLAAPLGAATQPDREQAYPEAMRQSPVHPLEPQAQT